VAEMQDPVDAALRRRFKKAKEEAGLEKELLESLAIEHSFVHPSSPPSDD
jgi:ribosomal protein S21